MELSHEVINQTIVWNPIFNSSDVHRLPEVLKQSGFQSEGFCKKMSNILQNK